MLVILTSTAAIAACDATTPSPPCCTGPPGTQAPVLVGAGDIGQCNSRGPNVTSILITSLIATNPDLVVFTAGDNAYHNGTEGQFRDCYDPWWGKFKDRTRPAVGNHDMETDGGAPYYNYFGDRAGERFRGYYTFMMGSWRVIVLNSEINKAAGSTQMLWFENELVTNPVPCTVAIWHRPRFSSGPNGDQQDVSEPYRLANRYGVEVIINGHEHLYERFAPQTETGQPNPRAPRQFVVGTGGVDLNTFRTPRPNSVARHVTWGVLKLELPQNSYAWEFWRDIGVVDSGTGECH